MKEETKNIKIITKLYISMIAVFIVYIAVIFLSVYAFGEGNLLGFITVISTIMVIIVAFYGLKIELETGYYECRNCHEKYVPSYYEGLIAPHMGTTRYMRCPKCNEKTWSKKVMSK